MLTVKVTIVRGKDIADRIRRLGPELRDFTSAMKDIGKSLGKYYSTVAFASQGGVFGAPWPSLSPLYAVEKAKKYPGRGLLIASGVMQDSFVSTSNSHSALVTNSTKRFVYHQSPDGPRTRIPRRQMIGVNTEVEQRVRDILTAAVQDKIRKM